MTEQEEKTLMMEVAQKEQCSDCFCYEKEMTLDPELVELAKNNSKKFEYPLTHDPYAEVKPGWAPCSVCQSLDICCGNREKALCTEHCTCED